MNQLKEMAEQWIRTGKVLDEVRKEQARTSDATRAAYILNEAFNREKGREKVCTMDEYYRLLAKFYDRPL